MAKVAIVTGASRGLGLAVAKAVARRGATVVALNRTLVAETEAILKEEGAAALAFEGMVGGRCELLAQFSAF